VKTTSARVKQRRPQGRTVCNADDSEFSTRWVVQYRKIWPDDYLDVKVAEQNKIHKWPLLGFYIPPSDSHLKNHFAIKNKNIH